MVVTRKFFFFFSFFSDQTPTKSQKPTDRALLRAVAKVQDENKANAMGNDVSTVSEEKKQDLREVRGSDMFWDGDFRWFFFSMFAA